MMAERKWLLKGSAGAVEGPYSEGEILAKLRSGALEGTERVALYPEGRWKNIAQVPQFYEEILRSMEIEGATSSQVIDTSRDDQASSQEHSSGSLDGPTEETREEPSSSGEADFEDEEPTRIYGSHSTGPEAPEDEEVTRIYGGAGGDSPAGAGDIIELEEPHKIRKRQRKKHYGRPIKALVVILVLLFLYLVLFPGNSKYRSLLRPSEQTPQNLLPLSQARFLWTQALEAFVQDTHSGYLKSQDLLVQLIEGGRPSAQAYELLCVTYRELWNHVRQDAGDLTTVREVSLRARRFNPVSSAAHICDLSERLLSGQYARAEDLAETLLQSHPGYVFLNEMSGEIQEAKRNLRSALFHYGQAKILWDPPPPWVKVLIREAQVRMELASGEPRQWAQVQELLERALQVSPSHPLAMILRARVELVRSKNHERSLEYIRAALGSSELILPSDKAEANYVMALILEDMGERTEAIAAAQRAYSLYPFRDGLEAYVRSLGGQPPTAPRSVLSRELMFLGDQYVRSGNCLAAQKEYRGAFEKDSSNALAAMKAAQCLWALHQSEEAINYLDRALAADSNLISAYVLLADYHSERYNQRAAFQVLEAAYRRDPKNYVVLKGFANFELKRRNFRAAEQHARRALELYGSDVDTLFVLIEALIFQNEFEEALKLSSLSIELEDVNPRAHIFYARALREIQGNQRAGEYLREKIKDLPRSYELRREFARLLFYDTKYLEAREMVGQALSINERDKGALILLADIQRAQGLVDEARESLLRAAALDPTDGEPLFILGHLNREERNYTAAVSQFETVLRMNPNYPLAQYALGRVSLDMGFPDKALDYALEEKRRNPGLAAPYILAAEVYTLQRKYSDCVREYQQALDRSAPSAVLYVRLARCFRLSGSLDAASTMLDQAVLIESGNPDVYKEQGAIYEGLGDYEKARVAYEKYLQLNPVAPDRFEIETILRRL